MNATISNMQLVNTRDGINVILRQKISRKAQLKILQLRRWLEGPLEDLEAVRRDIEDKHAERDKDSVPVVDENGVIKTDRNKFAREWRALLYDEQEYENIPKVKASLFGDGNTEDALGEALAMLGPFLVIDLDLGDDGDDYDGEGDGE